MRTLLLALGLVAATAACSSQADAPPEPTPMGHSYVSTEVAGTPIPGGGPLELAFDDSRLSGTAGCNRATATVDLSGGTLKTGEIATTMMACLGDRANADEWMGNLLRGAPKWSLAGDTLTLVSGNQVVTMLDRTVANPDRPLVGTNWIVRSMVTADAISTSAALEQSKPSLLLDANNTATGSTGCNRYTGPATVTETAGRTTIEFGPLATTRMACAPEIAEVETFVTGVLTGTVEASIDADELRLTKSDGSGLNLNAE